MRIFLDDIRLPSDNLGEVIVVRDAKTAMDLVKTGKVIWISFDHDLGTELTGYDVAMLIEEMVFMGDIRCPEWDIHSANPVGRERIRIAMLAAESFDDSLRG
jgi:hypothetical protein